MIFEHTKKFIYEKCAQRIKNRITEKQLTLKEIYPSDEKLISRIINCKITSRNPYLLQNAVLKNIWYNDKTKKNEDVGIIPKLGFNNEQEVLWGTDDEIESNVFGIFRNLINDLLPCDLEWNLNNLSFPDNVELDIDIKNILCDYIPYAKYLTYWRLFFGNRRATGQSKEISSFPALYYGISEDILIENIDNVRTQAISYLFLKPQFKEKFQQIFIEFCSQHTTFKKLDKKLIDFVKHKVISLLKEYAPDENSLGLRVMHIIESDLFKKRTVTLNSKEQNTAITRLINVSASYIEELEQLQEEYMSIHGTTI